MKRKLLSLTLILTLALTTAVCAYGANAAGKNSDKNEPLTVSVQEQAEKEKAKKGNSESNSAVEKERILLKKEQIRSGYSAEELDAVNDAASRIKKEDPGAKVLDIASVISNDAEFKFDTPPVIKGGRTLIPARAITEGFGAELAYDKENQLVTVTKGDTVIELTLGSMVAVVNGQEVQMDTKANIVNNRTYVPLRFIMETFRLSVEWDEETETIEIDDDPEVPDTTSGGAVTTGDETTTGEAVTVNE